MATKKKAKKKKKSTQMGFYLTNSKNGTIQLPVNPAEVSLKWEKDNQTYDVSRLGQISIPKYTKIREVTLSFPLPLEPDNVHYTASDKPFSGAQKYIDWLKQAYKGRKAIRLVVSTTKINFTGTLDSLEIPLKEGFAEEYPVTIMLRQYKAYKARKVKKAKKSSKKTKISKKGQSRAAPPKKVGRGSTVIVNGRLYRDSQGNGAGATERNAQRKISLIAKGAPCPYHITTTSGGDRGWVKGSAVKGA
ncbi:hypothetical protein [Lentilactobacillus parabuchneri]|uniref:hypothetical protein n=1 Tax=Lentilactobacillus parabuchneri TaxID=152331 RepID=UPI0023074033|nr:hypothetical protein [Lentilactobacillus parabuchneri]MDB1102817.1 hypothetical protein [Lentilactobacillus parabuchneri]